MSLLGTDSFLRLFAPRGSRAKETISKAFGTGIGAALGWHDMEICRKESGEPFVVLHGKGKELLEKRNARAVLISLSHTQVHATAVAVLESL